MTGYGTVNGDGIVKIKNINCVLVLADSRNSLVAFTLHHKKASLIYNFIFVIQDNSSTFCQILWLNIFYCDLIFIRLSD